jgi:large subunit ribosomal protein L5
MNKFFYLHIKKLPKFNKIILNFGCKAAEIKDVGSGMLALELLTNQKGVITVTKKPNMLLKIRKGNPTGCKVTLNKVSIYNFLSKIIVEAFPKMKDFKSFTLDKKMKTNIFSFKLREMFSFSELEKQYYMFNNLPSLNVIVITNCEHFKELVFLLESFKFPLEKELSLI